MLRDIVKLRCVGGTHVLSIPKVIIQGMETEEGDRFLIEVVSPTELRVTKESTDKKSTRKRTPDEESYRNKRGS